MLATISQTLSGVDAWVACEGWHVSSERSRFAIPDYRMYSASICVHDDISTWYVASVHMYSTVSITGILHLGLVSDI